jgi:hypothetical protein
MLLSSSTPFLSFYFVIELLTECALTRLSLKQLKIKYSSSTEQQSSEESSSSSSSSSPHSSYYFKAILKAWTVFAFIALWGRHLEPAMQRIPGSTIWYGFYSTIKCIFAALILMPQLTVTDLIFNRAILPFVAFVDRQLPILANISKEILKTIITWLAFQSRQCIDIVLEVVSNISFIEVMHTVSLLPFLVFAVVFPVNERDDKYIRESASVCALNEETELIESHDSSADIDELFNATFSYDFYSEHDGRVSKDATEDHFIRSSIPGTGDDPNKLQSFDYDGLDIIEPSTSPMEEKSSDSEFTETSTVDILSPEKFGGFIQKSDSPATPEISELVTKTSNRLSRFSMNFSRSGIPGFKSLFGGAKAGQQKTAPKLNLNLFTSSPRADNDISLESMPSLSSNVAVRQKKSFRGAGLKKLF